MTILLSDPRVSAVPLHDDGESLVALEWWHWSFGDRYWALAVGAPTALYGPLLGDAGAA